MTSTSIIPRFLMVLALVGLFSCKQEEGETCFEDDDCSGALQCECKSLANERGLCLPAGAMCRDTVPVLDAGPVVDQGAADLGGADLGGPDLGEPDLGPDVDLGPVPDLGTETDLGPQTDLGTDSGPTDMGDADSGAGG